MKKRDSGSEQIPAEVRAIPRKRTIRQRFARWLRRVITQSDDPDASIAFFRTLR